MRDKLLAAGARMDVFTATAFAELDTVRRLLDESPTAHAARDPARNSPLHGAVLAEAPALVDFWLETGVNPSGTNQEGRTASHLAAEAGMTNVVERLLAAGCRLDLLDTNGTTALDLATRAGHSAVIAVLLPRLSPTLARSRGLTTPLHLAITANNSNLLFAALTASTNLDARDERGFTPLHLAVQRGHLPFAKALLDAGGDVNARRLGDDTALQLAIREGPQSFTALPERWWEKLANTPVVQRILPNLSKPAPSPRIEVVELLLAYGADPMLTNQAGLDAAQVALVASERSEGEMIAVLEVLRAAGGDIEQRSPDGDTALHRAARKPDTTQLERLVAAGADLEARNGRGQTPLHVALEPTSTRSAAETLLDAGADPDARDAGGMTPLHHLASGRKRVSEEAVEELLKAGADPDLRDKQGRTPLHYLLSGSTTDSGRATARLLAAGADRNIQDAEGQTPLHAFAGSEDPSIFFLAEARPALFGPGVRPDLADKNGDTALHVAARKGQGELYEALRSAGANADLTNHAGESPLLLANAKVLFGLTVFGEGDEDMFHAIARNDVARVRGLLERELRLVHVTNRFGQTPLRAVAVAKRTNLLEFLFRHGAQWDVVSAAMLGRDHALSNLVRRDPRLTGQIVGVKGLRRYEAFNPLHEAASAVQPRLVELLVKAGAPVNQPTSLGRTAWELASRAEVLEDLIGRWRYAFTGPSWLEPEAKAPDSVEFSRLQREIVALLESLGAMPGQSRAPAPSSPRP